MTVATTAIPLADALRELLALRDPAGILSIYVDVGAERERRHRPREPEIMLRNRLQALRADLAERGERQRERLLVQRLASLAAPLQELVDPSRPGQGRALVVPLSGGAPREVVARRPMGDDVVLEPTAYLMPLLLALADEEPVGVVAVSGDGLRAIDGHGDEAEEVLRAAFDIPSEDWRPMVGPAAASPIPGRESESQRDLFARRMEDHRAHRIVEIAPLVWQEARRRGWRRVLAAGAPAHLEALAATRPGDGPELVIGERYLADTLTAQEVREATAEALATARRRAGRALAERVRDAALATSGRAAVGVADTLTALAEGRVHRLLLDPTRGHEGSRAPDGRLVADGEVPGGARAEEMVREPHLMERMLERAMASGALVTALEGSAADPLADHGGVAAELRW